MFLFPKSSLELHPYLTFLKIFVNSFLYHHYFRIWDYTWLCAGLTTISISGIILGGVGGTLCGARVRVVSVACKGKYLTPVLLL